MTRRRAQETSFGWYLQETEMRVESGRDVGQLWLASGAIFALCVGITRFLGHGEEVRKAGLWVGYVGLAAIGAALILTWRWLGRSGPRSRILRTPLQLAVAAGLLLWVVALVFPFL